MTESLVIYDDAIRLISDFVPPGESDKVRDYRFVNMKNISFVYPENIKWLKLKNIFITIIGLLVGADASDSLILEIHIDLFSGKKTVHEYRFSKITKANQIEKKLNALFEKSRAGI